MWTSWCIVAAIATAVAFVLRVAVHAGQQPGGVDTWYYMAYADQLRRRPGIEVRLPQYLLQDQVQSYAPLFPTLLALLPTGFRRRWYWTISPAVDCVQLLMLGWLAFKITASLTLTGLTMAVYAFTPHLVSETRSLSGRSFGALVQSVAMVLSLRYIVFDDSWTALGLALLAGAAVWLSSATATVGYLAANTVLSLAFGNPSYLAVALGAGLTGFVLSAGHLGRVLWNYAQAIGYWRRNRHLYGAHPVLDSPVYGGGVGARRVPERPGFLGQNVGTQLVRLIGENPFLLALPLAPPGVPPWGAHFHVWAVALAGASVLATLLPMLRAFAIGRSLLRTTAFPTAYTLAVSIGSLRYLTAPIGLVTIAGLAASLGAIAFFYWFTHRRSEEQTAFLPDGLEPAVIELGQRPRGATLCLPTVYADYATYHSGQPVLWGGHSGDLHALEVLTPLLREDIAGLRRRFGLRYVLLETAYVSPAQMDLSMAPAGTWGSFVLFDLGAPEAEPS